MKHLNFIIFLIALELFTMLSQGLPIKYTRDHKQRLLRLRQRNMRKSLKTPWKFYQPDKLQIIGKTNWKPPEMESQNRQIRGKCSPEEGDPEKWFVKVYKTPDTRLQKYIFRSVSADTEEIPPPNKLQSKSSKKLNDINGEFKRCLIQCNEDWLMIRCMPRLGSFQKGSGENSALVLCTKFLQINEPEERKNSTLSVILQRKGFPSSYKKINCP